MNTAISVLAECGLVPSEQIYIGANVSIFKGMYDSYPAVFKVLQSSSLSETQQLSAECVNLRSLNHPHIVSLYHSLWISHDTSHYLVIVLEQCDKDLAQEMRDRRIQNTPFDEPTFWKLAEELIATLADMQRAGLAHRDIKPENVFLHGGAVKVGDFGSSRYAWAGYVEATMVGTPLYLSPALRTGLVAGKTRVQHDIFRSDVYSLGMTFLALLLLEAPLYVLHYSEKECADVINSLHYSSGLKQLISAMLVADENFRPDFLQLCDSLSYFKPQQQQPLPELLKLPAAIEKPYEKPQVDEGSRPLLPLECLWCPVEIDRRSMAGIVELKCSPKDHVFCSAQCFQRFLRKKREDYDNYSPGCPKCSHPISASLLTRYAPVPPSLLARVSNLLCCQLCNSSAPSR